MGWIGRILGSISFSSILKNFDVDFQTKFEAGRFIAVVSVFIFGRRLFSQEYDLIDIRKSLTSYLDIDLVQKVDGEYLKVQFEIGDRVLVKELIKLSSVRAESSKAKTRALTLDDPIDVVRENRLSNEEFAKLISDVALGK